METQLYPVEKYNSSPELQLRFISALPGLLDGGPQEKSRSGQPRGEHTEPTGLFR